jgi:phosphoesterase RecJ-like protein
MNSNLGEKFQQINEALKDAKKVLVASHEYPDPDAVGSVLALRQILKSLGKEVFCYLPTPAPGSLNFLPGFFDINPAAFVDKRRGVDIDLFFCLDHGDFKRLRLPQDIDDEKIITIDHHLERDQRGKIKIIEPKLSSTAEIIFLWLQICPPLPIVSYETINKEIATCLLTGIISDTGCFSHICTSEQTMKIVSHLLLKGAPLSKIVNKVFGLHNPQSASGIWGKALSRLTYHQQTGLVYSWLYENDLQEPGIEPSDLAGISSFISTIPEAKLALFLTERKQGEIEGSLRTEPYKKRTVAPLAEALGGGGHAYAAGFHQQGTIEDVLKKVINLLE